MTGKTARKVNFLRRINNITEVKHMRLIHAICDVYGVEKPGRRDKAAWLIENITTKTSFCGVEFPKTFPKKAKKDPGVLTFYRTPEWEKLRVAVLRFYGCKCMKCRIVNCEMHVDHIKPRSLYPQLELVKDNLQVLCKDCNMEKRNLNEIDYRPLRRLA